MPRSIRFFLRNRWPNATSITAGATDLSYPATNTQTDKLDESWRSPQTTTYISADLGSTYKIAAVAVVKPNLSYGGTYRIRVSTSSSFATTLYDSGTVQRQRYYSDSEIAVAKTSEFFNVGVPNSAIQKRLQRQVLLHEFTEVSARYVRVDFADPANVDGYIEVGYVYAGRILQPNNDLAFNWKMQRDETMRSGRASCGQYWSAAVRQRTLLDFTLAPQPETDVLAHWFLLQTLIGITNAFIISLTDQTDSLKLTTTIYGKWVQVPVLSQAAYRHYSIPMQFEEIVG